MAETILKSILQELTENEKRVSQDEMEDVPDLWHVLLPTD